MTRIMYDAVTPTNIPRNAEMVAGYVNGKYAWTQQEWDLFPNATKVEISVRAYWDAGHVLDVEAGDATPAEAPAWAIKRRQAGITPTIYCNRSTWPYVVSAFEQANVPQPHFWIATGSRTTVIPNGAVAAQTYLDYQGVDISYVNDYWPGIDNVPVSNLPLNLEDEDMITVPAGNDDHANVIVKGKSKLYVACSYGRKVYATILFFGDTGNDMNGTPVGGSLENLVFISNRPGPVPIPAGAAMATIRYTADHSFGLGTV